MPVNELEFFLAWWDREAANTVKLLRALPPAQYRFQTGSRWTVARRTGLAPRRERRVHQPRRRTGPVH